LDPGKTSINASRLETDDHDSPTASVQWTQTAAQNIWRHNEATEDELKFMEKRGGIRDASEANAVKTQIAETAKDPEAALITSVQNHQVVGFSDMHVRQGPYFQFLIDELPKLKAAGITDVAFEFPKAWQKDLDTWTPETQKQVVNRLTDGQSLIDVIDAAKKLGLTVSAVDENYSGVGDEIFSRDKTMADNIEQLVKDEHKKVLYFAGAEHLASGNRRYSEFPTTAQRLRDDKISVDTFYQQISSLPDGMARSTRDLTRPVSVDTAEAPLLGQVQTAGYGLPPAGRWDNVIFYPVHYKMENVEAELNQFGAAPKAALKAAVESNRVVLLGEMTRSDPENPESQHRKLLAQMMPDLRDSGLTDLAINVPMRFQSELDGYVQHGLPDGNLPLPRPLGGADSESFKEVLAAAIKSGLKLHAIGQDIYPDTQMKDIIDGLSENLQTLSRENEHGKTLLWSDELFVAKFFQGQSEVSISHTLNSAGIETTAIADFSQDFDNSSPGVITQLLKEPVVVKPEETSRLKTIVNKQRMQMDRFDQVIVYPSE
jgi:hypothetical protein